MGRTLRLSRRREKKETWGRFGKSLLVALGGALLCALLTIAFLLGRLTAAPAEPIRGSGTQTAVSTTPVTTATTSAAVGPALTPAPVSDASASPATDSNALATAQLKEAFPASTMAVGTPSPSPERQQIAAYFAQMDRFEDLGTGDPQEFAKSMLDSMTSGDFSSFDGLLAKARSQRDRLRALTPPPSCIEHHRLAMALSADSVSMLERLKLALVKGDSTALLSMATEGRSLEAQAGQLKALGETLKRRAGN